MMPKENLTNFISIIITCFNEGSKLYRVIKSLNRQTYKNFEVIIVKDFSYHQETINICKELDNEGYLVLWADKNVGVSVTRNMGIERAKNEIIYNIDADDELPDNALELVIKAFEKHPEADVIFGNYELFNEEYHESKVVDCSSLTNPNGELDIAKFFEKNILYGNSPFLKSAWRKIHGYSVKYSFGCQDYEFQIRLLKAGFSFIYINEIIYIWHRQLTGINSSLQNRISVDNCYYEHIDYVEIYIKNTNYLMYLCKLNNDKKMFRKLFRKEAAKKGNKFLLFIELVFPYFFLVKMVRFL